MRERPIREGDRFVLPWRHLWSSDPDAPSGGFLRWMWERRTSDRAPTPQPDQVPRGTPDVLRGDHPPDECRVTFIGHASFLIQAGGFNVLTDPVFGDRASPLPIGPKRFSAPGLSLDELPDVHAVVLSHDHYDHLDAWTVDALTDRFGDALSWLTPLGYRDWFEARGVARVREADWWDTLDVPGPAGSPFRATAAPAQHWTRRGFRSNTRLWASWSLEFPGGARVFFAGDSGYWHGWSDIGAELGPWDATLIPIGAYEPRWFMRRSHMNPEEAVQTWRELGARGLFVGMHWGAFRLTDEPPLEPPERTRAAWRSAGHPEAALALPGPGGTVRVPYGSR